MARKWQVKTLSDVLSGSPKNGLSPSNGGTVLAKVLTLSAITGDRFKESAFKVATFNSSPPLNQSVDSRDLLICRGNGNIGLVGRGFFPTRDMEDTTFPDTMIAARPGAEIEPRFLEFLWNSVIVRRQIEALARTTNGTFKINQKMFDQIEIPVPPIPEQRLIAEVLDQADALRAKRREAIALLDDLTRSIFLDMFGDPVRNDRMWPRVPLRQLIDRIDSGNSPQCLDRPVEGNEWGVLKLGAITSCEYLPYQNKALPSGVAQDPQNEVKSGDLLFSRKNTLELVAACALVHQTPPQLLLPDLIFRIVIKKSAPLLKVYLHRLLIYPGKRKTVQALASGSASSMPNISKARLMELPVELPPTALQAEFSQRIDTIERLKALHTSELHKLNELFASVQQRAFRGNLWNNRDI
ncbi:restriction endonuclease subunit S [Nonomuraea aurantiaca]|uniref:restriction endonuclease subunit S n=1 Tax=Nonomuraea aurantiaca TaxID=2878562 RepID=UPI001CD946EA|nr:restriction endonuclease subunit S [Nonomuraea aurantiaca]MCA2227555.1 restriction endonuclease subunit S [Nonomuraea aurantiaca]